MLLFFKCNEASYLALAVWTLHEHTFVLHQSSLFQEKFRNLLVELEDRLVKNFFSIGVKDVPFQVAKVAVKINNFTIIIPSKIDWKRSVYF